MPRSNLILNDADEQAAIDGFNQNGFYMHRGLFKSSTVSNARDWITAQKSQHLVKSWTEQEPGAPVAIYSVVHQDNNLVSKLVNDPKILEISGKLMGKPTYVWASKVNIKAAWCGTVEYFHQDLVYWKDRGYPSDDMLTCVVFLEKHSTKNAAIHALPGTHKLGFIPHQPFININGLSKRMVPPKTLDKLYKTHGLVSFDAEPGDALFFHTSLVHGSSHNISPNGRMILLAQINSVGNGPDNGADCTKQFNILRVKAEIKEAERRLQYFQEKYKKQVASEEPTFCAPIPDQEK